MPSLSSIRFTASQVADYVDTAQEWARTAQRADPAASYPFFLWNCLWRSGASILHGHAQMALTRDMHYARVESWRQAALRYRRDHDCDYWANLVAIHRALGLSVVHGSATILPSLTPTKEKETLVLAPRLDSNLKSALYHVLHTFVDQLQVQSFNLVLYQPPLSSTVEDWTGFPFIFRIVDRGSLHSITSDVGAMEFFAQSVVTADPFQLADALLFTHKEEIP
jgi:galactose-1-phosphate uridylyltransferase